MTRIGALFLLALLAAPAAAQPFLPSDDSEVLERLPVRSTFESGELNRLKAKAATAPADADAATALADAYYKISRREGDPRYLGYAQAALAEWWQDAEAPVPVLVVRATLRQSSHEFDRAIADLDRAISRQPDNAQALLVRATVKTVRGAYEEALADCGKLRGLTQDLYVLACAANIEALTGNTKQARAALVFGLDKMAGSDAAARSWILSLLGEISERLDEPDAESHFKAALSADPDDLYTIGAYGDWLLQKGRPADVIPLVKDRQRVDGLLLRKALAEKALQASDSQATVSLLRARFDASRARGDTVHRREEARFQLFLNGDAKAALQLARENWEVQHEPADLWILAQAAKAAGDAAALDTVRQWLTRTRLEYPEVAELVK